MKTYTYFRPIPETLEELKTMYKKLALANHPDQGGSTEAMQAINAEYTDLFTALKNTHRSAEGEKYTARESNETASEFIDIISKLVRLPGIIIELCGSWLWITGETRAVKDELKEIGFRWSKNKTAWYYHRGEYYKKGKSEMSLDDIRIKYGSTQCTGRQPAQLAAAMA